MYAYICAYIYGCCIISMVVNVYVCSHVCVCAPIYMCVMYYKHWCMLVCQCLFVYMYLRVLLYCVHGCRPTCFFMYFYMFVYVCVCICVQIRAHIWMIVVTFFSVYNSISDAAAQLVQIIRSYRYNSPYMLPHRPIMRQPAVLPNCLTLVLK